MDYWLILKLNLILLTATSCFNSDEKYRELGRLKVAGIEGVYFKLYQENDLDYVQAIEYEIINEKDSIVSRRCFLTGTEDYNTGITSFTAGCHDSIIYLCYNDPLEVDALFDLKTGKGTEVNYADINDYYKDVNILFKNLQTYDSRLTANWNK